MMKFLIDSMPRTGSTSLATMMSCHPDIECLVEPFHPQRYSGQYWRGARDVDSLKIMLDLIWSRWQGIKHVWQVPGQWPFENKSTLNETLLEYAPHIISLERTNLLQRFVSTAISRRVQFWIGTREEFTRRLEQRGLPELDPVLVRAAIQADKDALARRRKLLSRHPHVLHVSYESLFATEMGDEGRVVQVNKILGFLGLSSLQASDVETNRWREASDPGRAKWNTCEIYERISGARDLEDRVGSDETGWLFR